MTYSIHLDLRNDLTIPSFPSSKPSRALTHDVQIVLGWASPLTYQVLGHLKTILIIACGSFFLDTHALDAKAIFGVILALAGAIIYSEEGRRIALRKDEQSATTTSVDQSISSKPLDQLEGGLTSK